MKLRNLGILLFSVILFIGILYKPLYYWRLPLVNLDPWEAVPANGSVFLEIDHWQQLERELSAAQLESAFPFAGIRENIERAITVFGQDQKTVYDFFRQEPFLAALRRNGLPRTDFCLVYNLQDFDPLKYIDPSISIHTTTFEGQDIIAVGEQHEKQILFFRYRNLLVIARSALVLEDAVQQLQFFSKSLPANRRFRKMQNKAKKVNCRAWLFPDAFYEQFGADITSSEPFTKLWPVDAGITFIDCNFSDQRLNLHGFISGNNFPAISKSEEYVRPDLLPAITSQYFSQARATEFFLQWNEPEIYQRYFQAWQKGTAGLASLSGTDLPDPDNAIYFFAVREASDPLEYLRPLTSAPPLLHQTYNIYLMDRGPPFYWPEFSDEKLYQPIYFMQLDHFVLFSHQSKVLENCIDQYLSGQTLLTSESYLLNSAVDGFQPTGSYLLSLDGLDARLKQYLKPSGRSALVNALLPYQKYDPLLLHLSGDGFFQARLVRQARPPKPLNVQWRKPLNAPLTRPPQFLDWQEGYIAAQDSSHQLTVLNAQGAMQFQRKLDGPMLSDIELIDFNLDGRRQLLFNTAGTIYLMDWQGVDMGSYPMQLQSPATAGLCLADYAGLRDYVFYVPCKNGQVYGFDRAGFPVPGWNPQVGLGQIDFPLSQLTLSDKDLHFIVHEKNKLSVFNRNGERVVGPHKMSGDQIKSVAVGDKDDRYQFYYLNSKGHFLKTIGTGNEVAIPLNFNAKKFTLIDLPNESRQGVAFLSDRELMIGYLSDNKFKLTNTYDFGAQVNQLAADKKKGFIRVFSQSEKKAYLFYADGAPVNGFPVSATQAISFSPSEINPQWISAYNAELISYGK